MANKTTRLKNAQAPLVKLVDLTPQLDGKHQSFSLPFKIHEQNTHYLLFNGAEYRNGAGRNYYTINEAGTRLTTYFDKAPTAGRYRQLALVVTDNGAGADDNPQFFIDGEEYDYVHVNTREDGKVVDIEGHSVGTLLDEDKEELIEKVAEEATTRTEKDNDLQEQIHTLEAASDVVDLVGTKADLDAYDTTKLHDNDVVKVLQDESQSNETSYYRWSATTNTFTLIGEEGPYYTTTAVDEKVNAINESIATKQDILTAGDGIKIEDNTVSTDLYDGVGLNEDKAMTQKAVTDALFHNGNRESVKIGTGTTGTAYQSTLIGRGSVSSQFGVSISSGAAIASAAIAIVPDYSARNAYGYASGEGSILIGRSGANLDRAVVTGENGIGIGSRVSVKHNNSVALGSWADTGRAFEVSVGGARTGYETRYIANVKDPELAQDAATKNYVDTKVGDIETLLANINTGTGV